MSGVDRPPVVSVIMSMRNSASTVGAAVRSVLLQTLRDWELIVIDDGSSDQSGAIVEGFRDGRIRLIRESRSAGLAARLNQAVALSKGEFIARMDADDICFPERLSRQVARLREDSQLDLVGCGAVVFTSERQTVGEMPVGLDHQDIVARPFVGFPFPHPTWCGRANWFRNNPYDSEASICRGPGPVAAQLSPQQTGRARQGAPGLSPGSAGSEETPAGASDFRRDRPGAMEWPPAKFCRHSPGSPIMPQRACSMLRRSDWGLIDKCS